MPWITRGLRDGIVTTRYPRRPDGYGDGFRAAITVLPASTGATRSTPASFPAPLLAPTTSDRHQSANPVVPSAVPGKRTGDVPDEHTGDGPDERTSDGLDERTGDGPDERTGDGPDERTSDGLGERTGDATSGTSGELAELCPTGAIVEDSNGVRVDRGRCILCGACVTARPDRFAFDSCVEIATAARPMLVVPEHADDDAALDRLRSDLAQRTRALRRSIHLRHVDAGSDGSEEWEIAALTNPIYDVGRLGIFFTASPRHADLLIVTGVATAGMAEPLRRTYQAMPDPKIVLAAGTDAVSGGLVYPTYATRGGVASVLSVDVWVPGSPPSPFSVLHGILLAMGLMPRGPRRPALEANHGDASPGTRAQRLDGSSPRRDDAGPGAPHAGLESRRARRGGSNPARSRELDEEKRR